MKRGPRLKLVVALVLFGLCCLMPRSSMAGGDVTPYGPTEYIRYFHSGGSGTTVIEGSYEAENDSSVVQEVSVAMERSVFAEFNGKLTTSFQAMVAEVGISNEVSVGVSYTDRWTVTINVPPYTTVVCEWGYKGGRGYGEEVYFYEGVPTDSWPVSGEWSNRRYSHWYEL